MIQLFGIGYKSSRVMMRLVITNGQNFSICIVARNLASVPIHAYWFVVFIPEDPGF